MAEIIDLTLSPTHEIVEISSDDHTPSGQQSRTQEKKKRKNRKRKKSKGLVSDCVDSSAQPSRAPSRSPDTRNNPSAYSEPTSRRKSTSPPLKISSPLTDLPGVFYLDAAGVFIPKEDTPPPPPAPEAKRDDIQLVLPSHVAVESRGVEVVTVQIIQPPEPTSGDEDYIEYLDYEDRKAPGLVRYFEVEGKDFGQSKPSKFKCKNCGAEGDHKTYECPIQICLTCGARDEHSTRSCPITKTCFTCGMKGHINKTCPNRFSSSIASNDPYADCDRCGSTEHRVNECPTLWRIYQYVNDEECTMIKQSREEKKQFAIGEGGEGYIGVEVWCYNCANTGHLGDDCDELPHQSNFPLEYSAFSAHNTMSGPFYDPATEPVPTRRGPRELQHGADLAGLPDDWDAGAPADVGKRGKNKDKERLEKRFREQEEDEGDDWFNDTRNVKRRGMGRKAPPTGPRGKTLKFGLLKDGSRQLSPPPSSPHPGSSGTSLLARLSDSGGGNRRQDDRGRDRHEYSHQPRKGIHIRGAATDHRNQDGRYSGSRKADWERDRDQRDRDRPGRESKRDNRPRYKGDYGR